MKAATLIVKTFDGKSYQLTATGNAGRFVSVIYDRDAGKISMRPRVPADM